MVIMSFINKRNKVKVPSYQLNKMLSYFNRTRNFDSKYLPLLNGDRKKQCQIALGYICREVVKTINMKHLSHIPSFYQGYCNISSQQLNNIFGKSNIRRLFISLMQDLDIIRLSRDYYHSPNPNNKINNVARQYYVNINSKKRKLSTIQISDKIRKAIVKRTNNMYKRYRELAKSNADIEQLNRLQECDVATQLLKQRLSNKTFNIDIIKQNGSKLLQIKESQINNQLNFNGDMKKVCLHNTISDVLDNEIIQNIKVNKGKRGGRYHHSLCQIPSWMWYAMQFKNKQLRLDVDIRQMQLFSFEQIYGLFPEQIHNQLLQGTFYQFINQKFYNNELTREQVKQIIFSKMFNNHKTFWKLFIDNIDGGLDYYNNNFIQLWKQNDKKGIHTATLTQINESQLFNQIFNLTPQSIVRFDQLGFIPVQYIEQILNIIQKRFGFQVPINITVNGVDKFVLKQYQNINEILSNYIAPQLEDEKVTHLNKGGL